MTESLLSFSNINLFGHRILEIQIVDPFSTATSVTVAADKRVKDLKGHFTINGVTLTDGNTILVWKQKNSEKNEIYTVGTANADWKISTTPADSIVQPAVGGTKFLGKFVRLADGFEYLGDRRPGASKRIGANRLLEEQLQDSRFARIYGFSFEGTYYNLQNPVLFLVHGDGELVSEDTGSFSAARAPGATSLTGLAAADFDFADGLRVWSYDKADYTIRMDVETGMFEQVLLDAMLGGGPGGMDASGMNARGMNARGMNARGMNARGMNARGMNARGGGNGD
ncbi:MAG: hypothetical protein H0T56_01875 [Pseudaminobacter sp.]|nr:hypothetical protein [Pseudaminobacter sp.]